MRKASCLLLAGALASVPAFALPPLANRSQDPVAQELLAAGEPVVSIPTANSIEAFRALDGAHVMVSLADRQQYLMTLNRECVGLRWAEHIGVSTSDNTIWAGFDTLTADGHNCPIRTIHRLPEAEASGAH
jgi:hypothetical protein